MDFRIDIDTEFFTERHMSHWNIEFYSVPSWEICLLRQPKVFECNQNLRVQPRKNKHAWLTLIQALHKKCDTLNPTIPNISGPTAKRGQNPPSKTGASETKYQIIQFRGPALRSHLFFRPYVLLTAGGFFQGRAFVSYGRDEGLFWVRITKKNEMESDFCDQTLATCGHR